MNASDSVVIYERDLSLEAPVPERGDGSILQVHGTISTDRFRFVAGSAMDSPVKGTMYYDETADKVYIYNGSQWKALKFED